MKFRYILCTGLLVSGLAVTAFAQDHTRVTEPGAVIAVTDVHVKPGMFNAYMNDLKNGWVKALDAEKEAGDVLDYGMYSVISPREGEANLILTVVYKNWATFDRSPEYYEELMQNVFGGMDEAREAGVARGELRTLGSEMLLQEVKFME